MRTTAVSVTGSVVVIFEHAMMLIESVNKMVSIDFVRIEFLPIVYLFSIAHYLKNILRICVDILFVWVFNGREVGASVFAGMKKGARIADAFFIAVIGSQAAASFLFRVSFSAVWCLSPKARMISSAENTASTRNAPLYPAMPPPRLVATAPMSAPVII